MSCYYDSRRDMLVLRCDGCGKKVDLYKGETDRLLCHDYIRENGWKTQKRRGKWENICDECVKAIQDQRRQEYIRRFNDA